MQNKVYNIILINDFFSFITPLRLYNFHSVVKLTLIGPKVNFAHLKIK